MVALSNGLRNRGQAWFADPPWTELSPEWEKMDDEVPLSHPARLVVAAVARLDLDPLFLSYSLGGSDALRPDLMLRIALIEMWSGRTHPSQWFKDTLEIIPLKWAGFGIRPSRSVWYSFRDRLGPLIDQWFQEVLEQAQDLGLTAARRGAMDGSFVAANASRHRLLNEQRLGKHRQELAAACEQDAQGAIPQDLPAWMAKTVKTRLEQTARYERAQTRLDEFLAANERRSPSQRLPRKKVVVSATDPESALGKDKEDVFRPLYNVQLVRDLDSPLILGFEVFAQNSDGGTYGTMLGHTTHQLGHSLSEIVCDATYVTACNLAISDQQQVVLYGPWQENDYSRTRKKKQEPAMIPKGEFIWVPEENQYRCPEGRSLPWIGKEKRIQKDGEINTMHRYRCSPTDCQVCPRQAGCAKNPSRGRAVKRSEHEDLIDAHRVRMATVEAKAIYRLRKQTVELAYGDMKQNRHLRAFSGRGLSRVRIEIGLLELVHNLMIVESELRKRKASKEAAEKSCELTS